MGINRLTRKQLISSEISVLWEFITDPGNLKHITPESMNFLVTTPDLPPKIYPGMMISYRVSPLPGIRVSWVTEITHVKEEEFFVDEQRKGPYRLWHHEHRLIKAEKGTVMEDRVMYVPPFGFLGVIANKAIIKKKLDQIFDYRERILRSIFG